MAKEVVISNWQILSYIVGALGFVLSLILFIMKLRESVPILTVLPAQRDMKYLAVRLENTSKYPVTVKRIWSSPDRLLANASVQNAKATYNETGISPQQPFWLLPGEQVTIDYWLQGVGKEHLPSRLWIVYFWGTQGAWRLPRVPFIVRRSRKDLEFMAKARYLKRPD